MHLAAGRARRRPVYVLEGMAFEGPPCRRPGSWEAVEGGTEALHRSGHSPPAWKQAGPAWSSQFN